MAEFWRFERTILLESGPEDSLVALRLGTSDLFHLGRSGGFPAPAVPLVEIRRLRLASIVVAEPGFGGSTGGDDRLMHGRAARGLYEVRGSTSQSIQ